MSDFEPFRFVFMADCQIGCYASFSGLTEEDVKRYAEQDMTVRAMPRVEGVEWDAQQLTRAVAGSNRMRPDFVAIGGDMIDDPYSNEQYDALRAVAGTLDPSIPLRWVPGNHDAAFDTVTPTAESLDAYRRRFGADRYAFEHKGVTFVVANTVVWDHPEEVGEVWTEGLSWLEQQLAAATERRSHHIILFGHHPLFTRDPAEADTYWNIPSARRRLLIDLLAAHDVRTMLCGHWHRNGGGSVGDLDVIVTGAVGYPLGADPSGMRIVDVREDAVEHEYVALDDL